MQHDFSRDTSDVSKALLAIQSLVELTKTAPFNFKRFETCKSQVLSLPLPDQQRHRHRKILEQAGRYIQYGEVGAGQFELRLLVRNLRTIENSDSLKVN
jgi:hypothetical protein